MIKLSLFVVEFCQNFGGNFQTPDSFVRFQIQKKSLLVPKWHEDLNRAKYHLTTKLGYNGQKHVRVAFLSLLRFEKNFFTGIVKLTIKDKSRLKWTASLRTRLD